MPANQQLAIKAMDATDPWNAAFLVTQHSPATARATREELERSMTVSLKHYEPRLDGSLTKQLREQLVVIGTKVRPDFSADEANRWVHAMLVALSDLAPKIAVKALKRAVHHPFEFPGQVEVKVREFASDERSRWQMAISRLKAMELATFNATHQRQIESRFDDKDLTKDEIHTLQKTRPDIVKLGIKLGYINPDDLAPMEE